MHIPGMCSFTVPSADLGVPLLWIHRNTFSHPLCCCPLQVFKAWLDDRQECRAALQKLTYLNQLKWLERKALPWGKALDEMDTVWDPPAKVNMGGGGPA